MIACVTALNIVAGVLIGIGAIVGAIVASALFIIGGLWFTGEANHRDVERMLANRRAHKERMAAARAGR